MLFNGSKSRCIVVDYRHRINNCASSHCNVRFTIGGSDVEIVDSWSDLGHVISCHLNDNLDTDRCHNKLVT